MEFFDYPPSELVALGIMMASHLYLATRLCFLPSLRSWVRDFLAIWVVSATLAAGYGVWEHSWLIIMLGWSAVMAAWIVIDQLHIRRKHRINESCHH